LILQMYSSILGKCLKWDFNWVGEGKMREAYPEGELEE
jgi:hypothetical protein